MQYTLRKSDNRDPNGLLYDSLEPVIRGIGMSLIELSVSRRKGRGESPGSVRITAVVLHEGNTGVDDCSRAHRAVLPRLELAFPGQDLYLEVSSPGIDRLIRDGSEFVHYIGRGVKCYRTDISAWTAGILCAVDEKKIMIRGEDGEIAVPYEVIAKARLGSDAKELK